MLGTRHVPKALKAFCKVCGKSESSVSAGCAGCLEILDGVFCIINNNSTIANHSFWGFLNWYLLQWCIIYRSFILGIRIKCLPSSYPWAPPHQALIDKPLFAPPYSLFVSTAFSLQSLTVDLFDQNASFRIKGCQTSR